MSLESERDLNDEHGLTETYLATCVTIKDGSDWVDAFTFCGKYGFSVHVITAWNPGDTRFDDETNENRNQELLSLLRERDCAVFEALGSDPDSEYREKCWAIVGLTDETAIDIGRRFDQVAIFCITDSRQTVMNCFDNKTFSRANPRPIGYTGIAEWINDPHHRLLIVRHLRNYFGNNDADSGYEGRQFEWFQKYSARERFTSNDILAISALSVSVPATTARRLIEDPEGTYNTVLQKCIAHESANTTKLETSWLWAEGSPFLDLFEQLGTERGVAKVVRSKLMAAKFPSLIPIRDSRVEALLEMEKATSWWEPMHQLLDKTKETLFKIEVQPGVKVEPLRKLDVILWMEARERGL
jgi:hypothetical protein